MNESLPPASAILASLGQAAFVWDIATDSLVWSEHVAAVFPDIPLERLASGAEFSNLIEPQRSVRSDALGVSPAAQSAEGAPYRIEYGVRANTSAPVQWIEETGCWFAGADGKPVRVQGIVRVNNEHHARDEQLVKLSRNDPLTGERSASRNADDKTRTKAEFHAAVESALATRFGLPSKEGGAEAPSAAAIAATQRFKKMVDALAAEPPKCTDPDPPGTLRTTALRLRVYADAPLFTFEDLNYLVELDDFISPELRALPRQSRLRSTISFAPNPTSILGTS